MRASLAGENESKNGIVSARGEVAGTLISDYLYRPAPHATELVVLLHGHQQAGKHMMDKLAASCPATAAILAPNAPFPLPERKADGSYRLGFTWYFYNPATDEYYIDMRVAVELVEGLVKKLGLDGLPKRLIGFSQGGYLAPFVAARLSKVKQVIGIASEYLPEELEEALRAKGAAFPPPFRADQLCGAEDDVVSLARSTRGHQGMLARGVQGELVSLASEGHRLTPAMQAAVRDFISRIS